jgi:hypothetical protein
MRLVPPPPEREPGQLEPLWLRLCPSCEALEPAIESCAGCHGAGVLDQSDEPFFPPPPFEGWTPRQLVALDASSRERDQRRRERRLSTTKEGWRMTRTESGEPVAVPERPRRLTQSEIIELLLQRGPADHSSVKLTRNAKGDTQIEVHVRTGEPGLESVEQARAKAEEQYDHLRGLYPIVSGGS